MKHVKALVIKAIMIWAIVWIVLTGLYDVSFMDSTIIGVLIVLGIYIVGDLFVLPRFGNLTATIVDAGAAAAIIWIYLDSVGSMDDIGMKVLIPTVLIAVGEWFFHKWLLRTRVVPDQRAVR